MSSWEARFWGWGGQCRGRLVSMSRWKAWFWDYRELGCVLLSAEGLWP